MLKMDSKSVYCICGQPYDEKQFMIECDACKEWFHGSCVGVWEYITVDLDKYHCPQCEITYGPSLYKKHYNFHRHNYSDDAAETKPVQTGTPVFIKELKTRHFKNGEAVIAQLEGQELTLPYLLQHGFEAPMMVQNKEGLQIVVPPETLTIRDIEQFVGSDRQIDVIDVTRQTDMNMKFGEFVNYFTNPNRIGVLNLISLEFTGTKLAELVEPPLIAQKLDWVNSVWLDADEDDTQFRKPEVQKYCLIGVEDSYTDFHVDFGGTSVWYHVHKGEKIFYLIKPTLANLSLYQRWMTSSTQHETFFGDQVDQCYKVVVEQGNTMFIPTGWIHAVLTPVDSIVFGGNFLHSLNIPMQLQIYEIEKKIKTPERFRFPAFETINWYAAKRLSEELKEINEEGSKVPGYLLVGVKALLFTLKQWNQDKDAKKSRREEIPLSIEGPKLLKDLSKEIRHAERYLNSLNPPKPERESKRKKRKPVNKDFVDYSQPQHNTNINTQANVHSDQISMEVKEPLKLSIKVLNNKKFKLSSEENVKSGNEHVHQISPPLAATPPPGRPPLKLTLPKPATYPYSTTFGNNSKQQSSKSWFVAMEPSPHPKLKKEGELKVKLAKQPETPKTHRQEQPEKPFTQQLSFGLGQYTTGIPKVVDSVYDFHDDSDGIKDDEDDDDNCLTIDETPRRQRTWSTPHSKLSLSLNNEPLRVKLSNHTVPDGQLHLNSVLMNLKAVQSGEMEIGGEVDVVSDLPKNGIEELLKASCYTRDQSPKIDDLESGGASPSTREAIAGMLSISRTAFIGENADGSANPNLRAGSNLKRRKRAQTVIQDDFEDNIDKVHQDDNFIYPSLDMSDDEEISWRGKKKKVDEAWNPRAKVGQVAPKTDRPAREGARNKAVEKGLEAAAARRASLPSFSLNSTRRHYRRKKPKMPIESSSHPLLTAGIPQTPSTSSTVPNSSSLTKSSTDLKVRKPKKGMATAKQRLGKILKIHKMIH